MPKLDFGGYSTGADPSPNDRVADVVLPSPGEGLVINHDHRLYARSVQREIAAGTPAGAQLAAFQESLAPFLLRPGGTATAVDVPVLRRP